MHSDPTLAALAAHYQAMPPVAALQLRIAGYDGDALRLHAPLFADLEAEASLAEGESWDVFLAALRERGRARVFVDACVRLPAGGVAVESRARFVAVAKG